MSINSNELFAGSGAFRTALLNSMLSSSDGRKLQIKSELTEVITNQITEKLTSEVYRVEKIVDLFSKNRKKILDGVSVELNFRGKNKLIEILKSKRFSKELKNLIIKSIKNNGEVDCNYLSSKIEETVFIFF